jgi:hypothetical protein
VILGSNLLLSPDDVKKCEPIMSDAKILVTNLEISLSTALYSLKLAKQNKCKLLQKRINIKKLL